MHFFTILMLSIAWICPPVICASFGHYQIPKDPSSGVYPEDARGIGKRCGGRFGRRDLNERGHHHHHRHHHHQHHRYDTTTRKRATELRKELAKGILSYEGYMQAMGKLEREYREKIRRERKERNVLHSSTREKISQLDAELKAGNSLSNSTQKPFGHWCCSKREKAKTTLLELDIGGGAKQK